MGQSTQVDQGTITAYALQPVPPKPPVGVLYIFADAATDELTSIDSNGVIRVMGTGGGGGIGGSVAAGQVAVGNGVNTIGGSDGLTFSGQILGITLTAGTPGQHPYLVLSDNRAGVPGNTGVILESNGFGSQDLFFFSSAFSGVNPILDIEATATGAWSMFSPAFGSGIYVSSTGVLSLASAGVENLLLPTSTGTAGQVLSTDGGSPQQLSWVSGGGGGINGTIAATQIAVGSGVDTIGGSSALFSPAAGSISQNVDGDIHNFRTLIDTVHGGYVAETLGGATPQYEIVSYTPDFSHWSILGLQSGSGFTLSTTGCQIVADAVGGMEIATSARLELINSGSTGTVIVDSGIGVDIIGVGGVSAITLENYGSGGTRIYDGGAAGITLNSDMGGQISVTNSAGGGIILEVVDGTGELQIDNFGSGGTFINDAGGGIQIAADNQVGIFNTGDAGIQITDSGAGGVTVSSTVAGVVITATGGGGGTMYISGSEYITLVNTGPGSIEINDQGEGGVILDATGTGTGAVLSLNPGGHPIILGPPTFIPALSSDTGQTGQIVWDAAWIYICIATNTWMRSAISTW